MRGGASGAWPRPADATEAAALMDALLRPAHREQIAVAAGLQFLDAGIDGTGVPMTATQTAGRNGKAEDGRACTREVKLAVFSAQDKLDASGYPVRDPGSASYTACAVPKFAHGS